MNTIVQMARGTFARVSLFCAAVLTLALPVPVHAGGPLPWTALQFPEYWTVQPTSVSVTGTVETIIYQTTLPANFMGSSGFIQGTYMLDGDGVNTNHIITTYLGGTGTGQPPSGSTPLLTNTFTTTQSQPYQWFAIANNTNNSVKVWAGTTTNSFAALGSASPYTVSVGISTNPILFTITGRSVAAINTNWATLDAIILQTLVQP